jgi:Ca2+-binding RTX toxin-like protein
VAHAIVAQTATEDAQFSFTLPGNTFFDADVGDHLVYTARLANGDPLPGWLTFTAATGTFAGTPANGDVGIANVEVTATDTAGASASSTFALEVANVNDAPVVAHALTGQAATQDQIFTFAVPVNTFADVDAGDSLGYSAKLANGNPLPAWLAFDAATGTFSGTPANGDVGNLNIRVTATDSAGAAVSSTFGLAVANVNDAPIVVNPFADQVATEDQPFSFVMPANTFADIDVGDSLVYTASLANGDPLPAWLSFNAATGIFSGTPVNADVGGLDIRITARDTSGATAMDVFHLAVANVNDAPVLAVPVANQSATEDQRFTFSVPGNTFVDVDAGDSLVYTAKLANGDSLPSWLSFDAATATLSGTPVNDDVGQLNIRITATDASGVAASSVFALAIANVNDAPMSVQPLADATAVEDAAFSYALPANAFADVDLGDSLSYSAQLANGDPLPSWLSFDVATRTFSGVPLNADVGSIDVRVTATDLSGASISDVFNIATSNTNDAPVLANALLDQNATQDQLFNFVVPGNTFLDIDAGDVLTYSANLADGNPLPSWLTFNAATGVFSGTPANGDVGSLNVRVTATDGAGIAATSSFALAIANVNDAPILVQPLSNADAIEDSAFSYTVSADAFTDIDTGDQLVYTAKLANGNPLPSWLNFDAVTRTFSGTPANADVGNLDVRVTAIDASGAAVADVFTIAVANTNDAPVVVHAISGLSATEDLPFSFTVPANTFLDIDAGDRLGYAARLANGDPLPSWLAFDAATGTFSGTPANADVGSLHIVVTATDTSGAAVSSAFTLGVANVNDAPLLANPIADQSATEDVAFNFTLPASAFADIDAGDSLAYTAKLANGNPLPSWLVFDAATRSFSGTPLNGNVGNIDVRVTATDTSGASASDVFNIAVANVNDAPVLAMQTAAQTATEGAAFQFVLPAGTFSDADAGDVLTLSATLANGSALPSWLAYDAASRTFSGTPGRNDGGTLSLRVTATDTSGATAVDSFALTVNSAPGRNLIGTDGNDSLYGTGSDDVLDGRAGNDTLYGGGGNDVLVGGTGSDKLFGEGGDDVFGVTADAVWGGQYRVVNVGSPGSAGSGDEVQLSGSTRSYDIFIGGAGYDSLVGTSGNDALLLDDGFAPPDGFAGPRIQQIELISMGAGNDVVNLTSTRFTYGDVTIDGGSGNDVLWSSAGNDQLLGGDGNDLLDGGAGNDILDGGAGNDDVHGGSGNDILGGSAGNDLLDGGAGNDLLDGGAGNDLLAGGDGDDIYVHGLNGGRDVIEEKSGQDVIRFSAGISSAGVSVSRNHDDLVLTLAGDNGSVTVKNWFGSGDSRVERVEFADGKAWDEAGLRGRVGLGFDSDAGFGGAQSGISTSAGSYAVQSSYNQGHSTDGSPNRIADARDAIEARLARAPHYDFSALASYLSQQGSSSGPLTAAQIAQQWNALRSSVNRLGENVDGSQGAQAGTFGSSDDLVHGAMYWGYAGSVGQAQTTGGMTSLTGLNEGFKKLS